MYSVEYLDNYSDDTLLLVDYLIQKHQEELTLGEIFADIGLDQLGGRFNETVVELTWTDADGFEMEWHYAIDLVVYLSALLLECKKNGSVDLADLSDELEETRPLRVTATPDEHQLLNKTLAEFAAAPTAFDYSEMALEDELGEMAADAEKIRKELYE